MLRFDVEVVNCPGFTHFLRFIVVNPFFVACYDLPQETLLSLSCQQCETSVKTPCTILLGQLMRHPLSFLLDFSPIACNHLETAA